MKIKRVDHVGIAVTSFEDVRKFWEDVLGLPMTRKEEVKDQKVNTYFYPVDDLKFELLESTSPDGPIAKHLEKRGPGMQHIALEVENIEEALAELKAKGVRLIDEVPRRGVENTRIAFLHPKDTHGMLVELVEFPRA
ncbi:MAG TPA: methylmalonyl-CoA epimerase [Candidatus Thermoplasmatota archaeon]|nr:methylmalonyl-CoA epimerase [Candidatus Thermoplasmatota archaeon]